MKIRIPSLHSGSNRWTERVEARELDLAPDLFRSLVTVDFEVEKRPRKISVKLKVSAEGSFSCDRCGENFQRMVEDQIRIDYIQRDVPFEDESSGDDLKSYRPGQVEIDVGTDVRDALSLAVPMKVLCREECRGLCPGCGANLNYEPCTCCAVGDRRSIVA